MGTTNMAQYQFSNSELYELKALLEGVIDVIKSPVLTERSTVHVQTINRILAARSTR